MLRAVFEEGVGNLPLTMAIIVRALELSVPWHVRELLACVARLDGVGGVPRELLRAFATAAGGCGGGGIRRRGA